MRAGAEIADVEGADSMIGRDPRRMTQAELRSAGHEPKPVLAALRERCIDCCGGSVVEVRRCIAVTCPAWPFRMGVNPWREKRLLQPEQKAAMARRLAEGRARRSRDPSPQSEGADDF